MTETASPTYRRAAMAIRRTVVGILIAAGALWVAQEFLLSLVFAGVLSIGLWPLFRRLRALLPHGARRFAPVIFTLLVVALILGPVSLLLTAVVRQAAGALPFVQNAFTNGIPRPDFLGQLPMGSELTRWWDTHVAAGPWDTATMLASVDQNSLLSWSQGLAGGLARRLLLLLVGTLAFYAMIRNGDRLELELSRAAGRMGASGNRIRTDIANALRGVFNSTVIVAAGMGIVMGIAYTIVGVPSAILFAALTGVGAMVPLGAWLGAVAASLTLAVSSGAPLWGVGLFAFCAVVILASDSFVTPTLAGAAARMPFLVTLVGMLGGVETLGIVGLFIGPAMVAGALSVWREWVVRTPVLAVPDS